MISLRPTIHRRCSAMAGRGQVDHLRSHPSGRWDAELLLDPNRDVERGRLLTFDEFERIAATETQLGDQLAGLQVGDVR